MMDTKLARGFLTGAVVVPGMAGDRVDSKTVRLHHNNRELLSEKGRIGRGGD